MPFRPLESDRYGVDTMYRSHPLRRTVAIAALLITTSMVTLSLSVSATPEAQGGGPVTTPLLAQILGLITDDDSFATTDLGILLPPDPPATPPPTQHYGPYASTSPDSGTCGNDWAQDMFDRHFTVFNRGNSLVVVQQFKGGSFVTNAGPSPGACQDSAIPAGTVAAGVTGTMHGYFVIPIPPGSTQISNDPSCVAGNPSLECTTAGFIDSHFDCTYLVSCFVTTFFFHYAAGDQDLIMHEWKNASDDRGGNHGDIRSMNAS